MPGKMTKMERSLANSQTFGYHIVTVVGKNYTCSKIHFIMFYSEQGRGHEIEHFGGIKQCKSMVVLRDFPKITTHCLGL